MFHLGVIWYHIAGFSPECEEARRYWTARILAVAGAEVSFREKVKEFKPKFPDIPVLDDYKRVAPALFWDKFPVNLVCPGKPSLISKKIKMWVNALGCSDTARLNRVLNYIDKGADIGCRVPARGPSRSSNAASAYQLDRK